MGLYSTDTPGTGGSIKEKREDFAVNEVLAEKTLSRIAENTGYAVYKLDKNGIDTNHALAEVQKRTGVRLKALGLKDSRAVTSQYVCATSKMAKISKYGGRFSILDSPNAHLLDMENPGFPFVQILKNHPNRPNFCTLCSIIF